MNEIIADITNNIVENLKNRELPITEELMLSELEEAYNSVYFHIFALDADHGAAMANLVAITQTINALTHFNK